MLIKLAIEPAFEAFSDKNSFGFRPGRGCWDCRIKIRRLIEYSSKTIIEGDLEKCFDNLDHTYLLDQLSNFTSKIIQKQIQA